MDRFALIGYPIGHSLSPKLFEAAYGGEFAYDLIEEGSFEKAWSRFMEGPYRAINITTPFKEPALAKVFALESEGRGIVSAECRKIGATNLCVRTERGIECFNSDYRGVKAMLASNGFGKGSTAVIVGYGGAGKAAAAAAEDSGLEIAVCNRSAYPGREIRPLDELPIIASACELMIYTLPMAVPQLRDALDPGFGCAMCQPVIIEANYRQPCLARYPGKYIGGKEWLLAQAETGYGLMTGKTPDSDAMKSIIF